MLGASVVLTFWNFYTSAGCKSISMLLTLYYSVTFCSGSWVLVLSAVYLMDSNCLQSKCWSLLKVWWGHELLQKTASAINLTFCELQQIRADIQNIWTCSFPRRRIVDFLILCRKRMLIEKWTKSKVYDYLAEGIWTRDQGRVMILYVLEGFGTVLVDNNYFQYPTHALTVRGK